MATLITKNSSTASAVPAAGDLVKGELAVNVTDKKVYTKDNSAAVVKLVGSLGNQEANAVAITGGTINGTTIGATTPSTGAFTTASASSGFTGNLTGNVTGNVSGTAANVTGVVAIANGGTGLSALGTGVQSALGQTVTGSGSFVLSTSPSLTTPNLGTPSAAVLTNATGLPLTTGVTGTLGVANGGTGITAFGTGVATALGQNVTGSGGIVLATSPSLTTPNLGTPSAATLTNATGLPISTGVSGLGTGVATALAVNVGTAGAFVVNGGALGTPSSGTLTNCTGYPTSALSGSINLATQVTGTLATTNGGTGLTSFTANGVVYASSSSALTTGSALTFNGTSLGVGSSAYGDAGTITASIGVAGSTAGGLQLWASSAQEHYIQWGDSTSGSATYAGAISYNHASDFMRFWTNSTEQMRLTSTGLGIGTSSPKIQEWRAGTYLTVANASTRGQVEIDGAVADSSSASLGALIFTYSTNTTNHKDVALIEATSSGATANQRGGVLNFYTKANGTASPALNMALDSSGNLGLGVTPSAWISSGRAIDILAFGSVAQTSSGSLASTFNAYQNSAGNWIYKTTNAAAQYQCGLAGLGQHAWFTAGSSTAGNTISFTQAMTLDASGNLRLGTTSSLSAADRLTVVGGNIAVQRTSGITTFMGDNTQDGYAGTVTNHAFALLTNSTERARITSGGDLLVGTTTSAAKLTVEQGGFNANGASITNQSYNYQTLGLHNTATANDNLWVTFGTEASFTTRGSISYNRAGGLTVYNTTSDYRAKDIIGPVVNSGATIDALKVYTGKMKGATVERPMMVAHEAQAVTPYAVTGDKDAVNEDGTPKYQQMDHASLVPLLIAELQSLRARVAQLEAK